jgi:hypothetical protein
MGIRLGPFAAVITLLIVALVAGSMITFGRQTATAPQPISTAATTTTVHLPPDQCLTPRGFVDAMQRIPGYFSGSIQPGDEVICEDFTATSRVILNGEPVYIVLARSEGGWNGTNFNGQGKRPKEECATLPPKIYAYLKDACV